MGKNEGYSVKREIINAVMKLMTKKSYMDITVTNIINTAQVARASFYRNFNSINDVIEIFFPFLHSSDERKWREYLFNHFYSFTRTQRQMGKFHPQNMDVLFSRIDDKITQKAEKFSSATIRDKYLSVGKIGLVNGITKKWMHNGMQETPEEMIDYIMSFITLF